MRSVRDLRSGAAVRVRDRLAQFNAAHPWSHNDHFHDWVLRNLPADRRSALDVGCGQGGLLERLAPHFSHVRGLDPSRDMRAESRERCARFAHVTVDGMDLADLRGTYDLVTMVAVLHHLDEEATLHRVATLLAPGGRLLVVGLARPVTATDLAWDLASAVTNPLIGVVKHPRRSTTPASPAPFPTRDPELSIGELRRIAAETLPGSSLRRRLAFRYTLAWTEPPG